jgi:hypothetical protein
MLDRDNGGILGHIFAVEYLFAVNHNTQTPQGHSAFTQNRITVRLRHSREYDNMHRDSLVTVSVGAIAIFVVVAGCDNGAAKRAIIERAQAQVRRISADLDKRTTETGVYVRTKEDEIKEEDPWGTQIQISYSQGGVAETVNVRSAGPDRAFHTNDDVVAGGISANLKGIGEGIKKNTEETAAKAAKGLVKGTVEGVKESVKDALPFRKKKKTDSDSGAAEANEGKQPTAESQPAK